MQNPNNLEKLYELLEQYEYAELSEIDKQLVLSEITESQYSEMRRTLDGVKLVLEPDIEPNPNMTVYTKSNESKINRFFNYQIKLYQVAVSIAIVITTFFMYHHSSKNNTNQMISKNDTLTIRQVDTVHTLIYDTVEIITQKVRYSKADRIELITQLTGIDCNSNLCPNEVESIIAMNNRNTISNDSAIKGLLLFIY